MSFLLHRVKRSDLEAGDHIYSWRTPVAAYSHHGIYVGEGKVIHFTHVSNSSFSSHPNSSRSPPADLDILLCGCIPRRSGVILSCLDCFVGDGSLSRYAYGVNLIGLCARVRSGTCTTMESDPPKDVIRRAEYLLEIQMFGPYDVLGNNCEDFALYCKTGRLVFNFQGCGGSGQASSAANVPKAVLLCLVLLRFVPGPGIVAAALANRAYDNYTTDIGVRDDAYKVKVEDLVGLRRFQRNAACHNSCSRHGYFRVQQGDGPYPVDYLLLMCPLHMWIPIVESFHHYTHP